MTDAALLELVRAAVRAELQPLLAELVRQRDTLTPAQRTIMAAVTRLYGPDEPFCTSGLADAARFDPEAATALRRACGGDVQRLGIALRAIADSGAVLGGMRLVRLPAEGGSRRWALEGTESG